MFLFHNLSTILLRFAAFTPLSRTVYKYQLCITDCRGNFRHVIIVARSNGPVGTLFSMRTNHSQSLSIPIIVRRNHPSFSSCSILASVETETGHVGDRAYFLPIELGPVSLGSVLNYNNVLPPGQVRYPGNVRGEPVEICGNDSFRLPRYALLDAFNLETIRVLIDISEYRCRTSEDDSVGGADKRERGKNHLVTRANICSKQRGVQGRCPVHHRYGMFCPDKLGKAPFKLQNPRPHSTLVSQDSTAKDFDSCVDFFLSKKRLVDSDQFPQLSSLAPVFSFLCSGA